MVQEGATRVQEGATRVQEGVTRVQEGATRVQESCLLHGQHTDHWQNKRRAQSQPSTDICNRVWTVN